MLVNVLPNSQFRAEGTVAAVDQCRFLITGQFIDQKAQSGLEISLRAIAPTNAELCSIATSINAPLGHMVVLGVTPTRSLTSAFVVQVMRKEPAKSR
jgi:hypothetical protein